MMSTTETFIAALVLAGYLVAQLVTDLGPLL